MGILVPQLPESFVIDMPQSHHLPMDVRGLDVKLQAKVYKLARVKVFHAFRLSLEKLDDVKPIHLAKRDVQAYPCFFCKDNAKWAKNKIKSFVFFSMIRRWTIEGTGQREIPSPHPVSGSRQKQVCLRKEWMSAPHSKGQQLIVVAKVLSKIRGTTNLSFGKYLSTNHLYLFIFFF